MVDLVCGATGEPPYFEQMTIRVDQLYVRCPLCEYQTVIEEAKIVEDGT